VKKIVILCSVLILGGMNSFGETNSVPQKVQSAPPPQKTAAKPKSNKDSREITRTKQSPEEAAAAHQTLRQRLFRPQTVSDYGAEVNQIFFPGSDQVADTMVRNTIVTIYPSGH
jgi:hypothetical protein